MTRENPTISRRKVTLLLLAGGVTTFAEPFLGAAASTSPDTPAAATIEANNELKFVPATVTVKVGDTVRWENMSVMVHTVTCDPDKAARPADVALPDGAEVFDSGNILPKKTFDHTFTVAGTYRYFCKPHEGAKMIGEVIVEP